LKFGQGFTTISLVVNPNRGAMDARNLEDRIGFASSEVREKILAQLQVEQAERDRQRVRREARQARWQLLQLVTALGTVAAVIISLWALFQGNQNLTQQQVALNQGYDNLQQQQTAAAQQDQASRYSSISQLLLELDKTIADQPHLICYLRYCDTPKPVLNTQDMQHAKQLAIYMVDFYQYLYAQLENLHYVPNSGLFILRKDVAPGEGDENWITWSETIVDGFKYSTMVCQALTDGLPAFEWKFVHAVAVTHECRELKDPGPSPYQ
jgi:hypothetical protein